MCTFGKSADFTPMFPRLLHVIARRLKTTLSSVVFATQIFVSVDIIHSQTDSQKPKDTKCPYQTDAKKYPR